MNRNAESVKTQIINTLLVLERQEIVKFSIPPTIQEDKGTNNCTISWGNPAGGRWACGKSFNRIIQYQTIIEKYSYNAIMSDYSVIRCAFNFDGPKLISQNLLWWPCPVTIDPNLEEELGMIEAVKMSLRNIRSSEEIKMRTPIRMDFDTTNNTDKHPCCHLHMQDDNTRINIQTPICFNQFMKFILHNCYPNIEVDMRGWNQLEFQYDVENEVEYANTSKVTI